MQSIFSKIKQFRKKEWYCFIPLQISLMSGLMMEKILISASALILVGSVLGEVGKKS